MPGFTYDLNIRGVPCSVAGSHEADAGMIRRWTEQGPTAQIRFMCDWNRGQDLAAALMGSVALADDGTLARIPPYNLPFAEKYYCLGLGDERPLSMRKDVTGWVYYDRTEITATFGALTWQVEGSDPSDPTSQGDPSGLPYTTTRFRVSSEVAQPPKGAFFQGPFDGGEGEQVDDSLVGILIPRVEISMLRRWQPRIPLTAALKLIGGVNEDVIRFGDREFPRGCLLFAGLTNDPRNDPNGFPVQDLEYTFLGKYEVEWNKFLSGKTRTWEFLNTEADGSGEFPFPYISFDKILAEYTGPLDDEGGEEA
jgi:hypothetical protein